MAACVNRYNLLGASSISRAVPALGWAIVRRVSPPVCTNQESKAVQDRRHNDATYQIEHRFEPLPYSCPIPIH